MLEVLVTRFWLVFLLAELGLGPELAGLFGIFGRFGVLHCFPSLKNKKYIEQIKKLLGLIVIIQETF